jgi:hypothetical protein
MVQLVLTSYDYESLSNLLLVPVDTVRKCFDSKKALHSGFKMDQLKAIIKFLREKGARVNITGNKGVLVDNIARVLWDDPPTPVKPVSNQTIASLLPGNVGHGVHSAHGGHVTIEHNTSWQPQWTQTKSPQVTFNDENFFGKQVPFYEHLSLLAVIPFLAREDTHPRSTFIIDEVNFLLVKERKRAVHARFFSKERKGDIPWNIDVVLKINGQIVDIQKLARKIRSKAYKDPYILPRPADVSRTVRPNNNTVEFCHPGESGFLILHLVKELDINSLISHVVTNKMVSAASRANMKNDDIEEMNYVLSMKCPLSCMRLQDPVRSKNCTHEQCFDLRSYIEYSYQQQLWHCPVCEIGAPYKDLIYDEHFKNIVTSTNADKVTVNPDGTIVDADVEPAAKRQKMNTPSTPTPPSAGTTPHSASSSLASSSSSLPPPPPATIIALEDSPPPSPLPPPSLTTAEPGPTPFVFAPPSTTPLPFVPVPPSFAIPAEPSTPPSAAIPPQLPTSPVTPAPQTPTTTPFSPTTTTTIPPPQTPPPTQQVSSTPPPENPTTPSPTTSQNETSAPTTPPSPTSTPHPQVPDLKQEPGIIKKILQKLTPSLPSSPSFAASSSPALSSHPPSLPTPPAAPIGGNTSSDAIVISDDDD